MIVGHIALLISCMSSLFQLRQSVTVSSSLFLRRKRGKKKALETEEACIQHDMRAGTYNDGTGPHSCTCSSLRAYHVSLHPV
jgi:hypothetical protein